MNRAMLALAAVLATTPAFAAEFPASDLPFQKVSQ
jgi:hypothetical protein